MLAAGRYKVEYDGVQLLRFVAAMLVVIRHSTNVLTEKVPGYAAGVWERGVVGVSVFFVISGFVMVLSGDRLRAQADGWKTFALRRIVRIVPLYWIATTSKLAMTLLVPAALIHAQTSWTHVVASYLFVPSRNALGRIVPLHTVGWTLNLEMFFYATFCVALFLRIAPVRFVASLFTLLLLWGLWDPSFSRSWPAKIYSSPMILLFLAGMVLGEISKSGLRVRPELGVLSILSCTINQGVAVFLL